jgi:serine/threonine-protein kinase
LAQKRLFKAENEAATLSRVITEPVPLLFQIAPQVSKEVSGVVMRSLDRDRDKRFPSCAAFADALEAAAALKDKVASPRELANYVNEVLGQEIAQQRDNVRAWLAHSEPSTAAPGQLPPGTIPSSSVSAAAISLPGYLEASHSGASGSQSSLQQPKRSRTPLVLGALLLIGLLGAGGYMFASSARSVGVASGTTPAEPSATPAVPKAVTADPIPSAVAAPQSAAPSAELPPPTPASALGVVPAPAPRPASQPAPAAPRPRRKKPSDDVDLRNPYR